MGGRSFWIFFSPFFSGRFSDTHPFSPTSFLPPGFFLTYIPRFVGSPRGLYLFFLPFPYLFCVFFPFLFLPLLTPSDVHVLPFLSPSRPDHFFCIGPPPHFVFSYIFSPFSGGGPYSFFSLFFLLQLFGARMFFFPLSTLLQLAFSPVLFSPGYFFGESLSCLKPLFST